MTALPTLGLLSITDGRLMGDIRDVYRVVSFFIDRDAFTHELPKYARRIEPILIAAWPDLAGDETTPWEGVRDTALKMHGDEIEVPDDWAGSLADGKGPIQNLAEVYAPTFTLLISPRSRCNVIP